MSKAQSSVRKHQPKLSPDDGGLAQDHASVGSCLDLRQDDGIPLALLLYMESMRKTFILALVMLGLLGCSAGEQTSLRINPTSGLTQQGGTLGDFCADGTSAIGEVFSTVSQDQFQQQVQGLVSATLNPASLGSVPLMNGVELRMILPGSLRASGVAASGQLQLLIKDSYTGTKDSSGRVIPAYPVSISKISAANRVSSTYRVVFADQYGSITLIFAESGGILTGTISYQNTVHVSGAAPAQGSLGTFRIASCAVFK